MSYIDLGCVQAAMERLSGQLSILETIRNELEDAEKRINRNAYAMQTPIHMGKKLQSLDENVRILHDMTACLQNIGRCYQKTERKITEVYDLDILIFPETKYQQSTIEIEEEWKSLLCFSDQ